MTVEHHPERAQRIAVRGHQHALAALPARLLLEQQRKEPRDVASLETVIYGGAPISPARLKEAIQTFGQIFQQIYSQSEAPNCAAVLRKAEHEISERRAGLRAGPAHRVRRL